MTKVPVNLALQGGGSHGAFTWGVLDRLVEEDWLDIVAISGTSAGAMNAVALAQGLAEEDPKRVQDLLCTYWKAVSTAAAFSPVQRTPFDRYFQGWKLDQSPLYKWLDMWSQVVSPYDVNPFNINALKEIVEAVFDFDRVNAPSAPKLYQSATNVRTGRLKLFRQPDISVDTTLASACLPNVFKAVEIDGEAFWDGGYMGNPPLGQFLREQTALDTVVVQINPFYRDEVPQRVDEINNRINEITFNSSLMKELSAAGLVLDLLEESEGHLGDFGKGRLHRIADEETMKTLNVSSKMNAAPDFLNFLFDAGQKAAETWVTDNRSKIGVETTWVPDGIRAAQREDASAG